MYIYIYIKREREREREMTNLVVTINKKTVIFPLFCGKSVYSDDRRIERR